MNRNPGRPKPFSQREVRLTPLPGYVHIPLMALAISVIIIGLSHLLGG